MSIPYLAHDDAGNVVSMHWMEPEAVDGHAKITGHNLVPIIDAQLVDELRLYHQRYKVVSGLIELRSKEEIDAIEAARHPQIAEGPNIFEQKMDKLIDLMERMPERMIAAMERGTK